MILDANSGAVLHNSSGDEARHPASLTKMMTLYLTFETIEQGRLSMSSMVGISEKAAAVAPSKLDIDPGEELTVRDAILALITKSANDVSVALAEKIGGSEENFVRLMNAKARDLGMSKTRYFNPNGLPHPNQVTTARDQITLALHLQDDFPQHYPMFATRSFRYRGHAHRNHNTLMNNFAGIDGVKTGYTRASGFNLVTSLRRGGRHLVGAVFGGASAATRNGEMRVLLTRALNRASTVKTRKPAPQLIAKLKSEPKRAERPAAKPKAVPVAAAPAATPPAHPVQAAAKAIVIAGAAKSQTITPSAPKSARPPAAPDNAEITGGAATPPQASEQDQPDIAQPIETAPVETEPVETAQASPPAVASAAPVEVTKVRRIVVAPRFGPKRPAPNPAETTDMAASDDGAGNDGGNGEGNDEGNGEGNDEGNAPDVSETIVPKTPSAQRAAFASVAETKASMLGASDVPPPEAPAAAPAATPATPAPPAAPLAQAATKSATTPRAAAAAVAPRAKVSTASVAAPAARPKAVAQRPAEKPADILRGTPPSSLEAQAAQLKTPQRVASLDERSAPAATPTATGGRFEIQIGAYANVAEAQKALSSAQTRAGGILADHASVTQPITKGGRQVFRARFRGFDANSAAGACSKLRAQSFDCFVMSAE